MRIRYIEKEGEVAKHSYVYLPEEHHIDNSKIDRNAINIINRLKSKGFEAFIVGGAVRDLMLNQKPKDFDIATNATPRQVSRIFFNARIIGKRFKLVHIRFSKEQVYEISTFRSLITEKAKTNNIYGDICDDAKRRDFTVNAFYYNPISKELLDFNNGFDDFQNKIMRSIIPLKTTFIEDPVRMIRLIKYSCSTGFKIPNRLKFQIRKNHKELLKIGSSRLTEEFLKIAHSNFSTDILKELKKRNLLAAICPFLNQNFNAKKMDFKKLDEATEISDFLYYLFKANFNENEKFDTLKERFLELIKQLKGFLTPLTLANNDIELMVIKYLKDNNVKGIDFLMQRMQTKIKKKKIVKKKRVKKA